MMLFIRSIPVLLTIFLFVSGCGSTSTIKRGKLSDAMEKSSNEYEGRRHIESQRESYSNNLEPAETENQDDLLVIENNNESILPGGDDARMASFGLQRGYGLFSGEKYRTHDSYYVTLGSNEINRWRTALFIGTELIEVNPSSSLYQSVSKDLTLLSIGIKGEYMLLDRQQIVRPYLMGGVGASYLIWRYNNSFTSSSGGTITSDSVGGASLHIGAGLAIEPSKFIRITAEFTPKLHLLEESTRLNFENDVFGAIGLTDTNINFSLLF